MNWLDIVIVILVVAGVIKGYSDGFIRQIVFFFALIAAIYFCTQVAVNVRGYVIQTGVFPESTIMIVSYILAFLMIAGIIMLAGTLIHKMISVTPLSLLNHLAGATFGLIVTLLFLSLTLNIVEGIDRRASFIPVETKVESRYYFYVKDIIPSIYPVTLFIWEDEEE